jgi:hypothetical protein
VSIRAYSCRPAGAEIIDAAIEQLLRGVAEEATRRREAEELMAAAEERAAAAEERMNQMERDCADAMMQTCALAENRIAADRQAAEKQGQLIERTWVLGLIGMMLDGFQERGAAAASLQSLQRMVEEGPIEITAPGSKPVA